MTEVPENEYFDHVKSFKICVETVCQFKAEILQLQGNGAKK